MSPPCCHLLRESLLCNSSPCECSWCLQCLERGVCSCFRGSAFWLLDLLALLFILSVPCDGPGLPSSWQEGLVFVKLETIPLYYILEIQSFQQLSFNFKLLKIKPRPLFQLCISKKTDIAQLENWFSARSQLILFVKKKEKKKYFQLSAPATEPDKFWHLFSWLPLTAFPVSMEMDIRPQKHSEILVANCYHRLLSSVCLWCDYFSDFACSIVCDSHTSETASRVESYIVCPRCHKLACLTVSLASFSGKLQACGGGLWT